MKLLRLAFAIPLWLAAAPALHAQGQPAQDSEWMVVGPQGLKFYLDGCNLSYSGADSAVLYFGEATVPAGFPAMLLDAGVVQGPQANLGRLRPSQTAILAKGDALAYLERSFPVGTVVSIEPEGIIMENYMQRVMWREYSQRNIRAF
jgi:hypothetical protein